MSITPFKDRQVADRQPVDVYLNLHKSEGVPGQLDKPWYSLRCRTSGRVLAHADELVLDDAEFVVNAAGRDKVRATGRKNVHAVVRGLVRTDMSVEQQGEPIFYDPYRVDEFVIAGTATPVREAQRVFIAGPGVRALDPS